MTANKTVKTHPIHDKGLMPAASSSAAGRLELLMHVGVGAVVVMVVETLKEGKEGPEGSWSDNSREESCAAPCRALALLSYLYSQPQISIYRLRHENLT